MNLSLDPAELRPLVAQIVAEVLTALPTMGDGRLAFLEAEAAKVLGMGRSALRDARLRGEVVATRCGGKIGYEKSELLAYLARNREATR